MQKLHFSIKINAPKDKVYNIMLADKTYREWTEVFANGSYYEGSWGKGSRIKFISPNENAGMISEIAENKPDEFLSIRHIGFIENGVEDTTSEKVKKWAGALENYTFKESDPSTGSGQVATEVLVDVDMDDEYIDMFNKMWPKALEKLKEICEK